jgi:hypothetical protein
MVAPRSHATGGSSSACSAATSLAASARETGHGDAATSYALPCTCTSSRSKAGPVPRVAVKARTGTLAIGALGGPARPVIWNEAPPLSQAAA